MIFENGILVEQISLCIAKFHDALAPMIAYKGDPRACRVVHDRGSVLAGGDIVLRRVRRDRK
jgi:hypothetical protein